MLIDQLATSCCVRYWTMWIQESQNCIAVTAPPIIHPSVPNTALAAESEWRLSRKSSMGVIGPPSIRPPWIFALESSSACVAAPSNFAAGHHYRFVGQAHQVITVQ